MTPWNDAKPKFFYSFLMFETFEVVNRLWLWRAFSLV